MSFTQRFRLIQRRSLMLLLGFPLLVLCSGCTTLPSWLNWPFSPEPLALSIRQVESVQRPGIYTVAGGTNLPEKTKITVTAIRYLQDSGQLATGESNPLYSILDRQLAEVTQGNWEARLNLWQVAPDGKFQEAWQLNLQTLETPLQPDPKVTFLATLDPPNQPRNFQDQVENQDEALQAVLTRFTTDGELYLQASRAVTVALPTGGTSPPPAPSRPASPPPKAQSSASPRPTNRSTDRPETPALWNQTNAPLPPEAFLR